jgi:hypothetical protein
LAHTLPNFHQQDALNFFNRHSSLSWIVATSYGCCQTLIIWTKRMKAAQTHWGLHAAQALRTPGINLNDRQCDRTSRINYSRTPPLRSHNLQHFLSGPFSFPIFILHSLPRFYVSKISNSPQFTYLECLQREQFWHKMVSAERSPVSTCFVTYYYHCLLVSHPTKMNMYTALQNKNGVSWLIIIVNKRRLTMPHGGWNRKADILKNCDE